MKVTGDIRSGSAIRDVHRDFKTEAHVDKSRGGPLHGSLLKLCEKKTKPMPFHLLQAGTTTLCTALASSIHAMEIHPSSVNPDMTFLDGPSDPRPWRLVTAAGAQSGWR